MIYKITEDLKLKKPAFINELKVPDIQSQTLTTTSTTPISSPVIDKSFSKLSTASPAGATAQQNKQPAPSSKNTSSSSLSKNSRNFAHVLSPQAIEKAKLLAKSQSYNATHYTKFSSIQK